MLEALAGTGLAAAAGLNAYIPLLALGLLSRFTDIVALPSAWIWLENGWVLGILGGLFLLEFVADKFPAIDHVNDLVHTVVRPTAGGIVFGSGTAATTPAISDPGGFVASGQWVPIVSGVLIALVVHLAKAALRAAANAITAGLAAPFLSVAEDISSVMLVVVAILLPVAVLLVLAAMIVGAVLAVRALRRARQRRAARDPLPAVGRT